MKDFDIEQIMSLRALEFKRLDLYKSIQHNYMYLTDYLLNMSDGFNEDSDYEQYIESVIKSSKKDLKKLNKKVKKLDALIIEAVRR